MQFIFIQIATLFCTIAIAWLQKIPVIKMRDFGASIQEEKQFHNASVLVRFLVLSLLMVYFDGNAKECIMASLVISSLQWLCFDIALNLFTHREWDYIGETAGIDKDLNTGLGKHAGKIKAAGCIVLIITLNVLYFLL